MNYKIIATLSSVLLIACTESTVKPSTSYLDSSSCESLLNQSNSLNSQSSYNLANCYALGVEIDKNHVKAAYWLEQSANQGFAFAQFKLAQRYYLGFGVEQNKKYAFQLFNMAANQGNHPAEFYLGYFNTNGIEVKKSDQTAVNWYKKSALGNFKLAQSALSEAYEDGVGIDKSWEKRTYWLEIASLNHQTEYLNEIRIPLDDTLQDAIIIDYFSNDAQYLLGTIFLKGDGLEKNKNTAIKWLNLSSNENNEKAQLELAKIYIKDESSKKSIEKAISLYTRAANSGEGTAQFALAKIYYDGDVTTKNLKKAVFWANLAKQNNITEADKILNKLQ